MWLKVDGFIDIIKGWQNSYQFHGMPSFILPNKLKATRLKEWNETDFGNIVRQKLLFYY